MRAENFAGIFDAVVVAVPETLEAEKLTNRFRPRYAVNVRRLDVHGKIDERFEEYESLSLPDTGVLKYPPAGTIVKMAYANSSPTRPCILSVSTENQALPALKQGEVLISQDFSHYLKFDEDGNLHIKGSGNLELDLLHLNLNVGRLVANLSEAILQIGGDVRSEIQGSLKSEVSGFRNDSVGSDWQMATLGNLGVSAVLQFQILAQTLSFLSSSKIKLHNALGVSVVDLIEKIIEQLENFSVITPVGSGTTSPEVIVKLNLLKAQLVSLKN